MLSRILDYYKKFGKKHYTRPIKKDAELLDWLNAQTAQYGKLTLVEQLAVVVHQQSPICDVSKNKRKFINFERGFGFCGKPSKCECARNHVSNAVAKAKAKYSKEQKQLIQSKRAATNIKKYGVANQGQRVEVQEKQRKFYQDSTNLMLLKQKIQATIKAKYGNTALFYQKRNQKSIETNMKKRGCENPMQCSDIKQKMIVTKKINYNPSLVWSRNYQTLVKKMQEQHSIQILTPESQYMGLRLRPMMQFQCMVCGNKWDQRFDHANFPRCKVCNPADITYKSNEELEILDFIKNLGFEVESGNRTLIPPYEVDIVVPEKNIAVEYCGLYWHCENSSGKGFGYHKKKFDLLKNKGYQLITIFSDEWIEKKSIVMSMIKSKLGLYDQVIFARKTQIVEPSKLEVDNFLQEHHILGTYKKQNIALGLCYNGQLVACGVFAKISQQKYEMVRFASSCKVVGGASKILKNFCKKYQAKTIVSFSDNRFSMGHLYQTLGFERDGTVPPMQYYVYNYAKRYHKLKFEKKKLVKMGYDPSLSEWEIMQSLGYDRIWDAGKIKWKFDFASSTTIG